MTINGIIRCKYCKENVRVGLIHDCKTGRRQASSYDAYYDGSCHLGSVLGNAIIFDSEPDEPCSPAIDTTGSYSCSVVNDSSSYSSCDSSSGDSSSYSSTSDSSCSWSE